MFSNIIEMSVINNNITDLTKLYKLSNITLLKSLTLTVNNVSDINPLKKFINLEYLKLDGNNVIDIDVLQYIKKLEYIDLSNNDNLTISTHNDLNILQNIINNGCKKISLCGISLIDVDLLYQLNLENNLTFEMEISALNVIIKENPDHPIIQSYDFKTIENDKEIYYNLLTDLNMIDNNISEDNLNRYSILVRKFLKCKTSK